MPLSAQRDKFDTIQCHRLEVVNAYGKAAVVLGSSQLGGVVAAICNDGKSIATLGFNQHGGRVQLDGRGLGKVILAMDGNGEGSLWTWNKDGYRSEVH